MSRGHYRHYRSLPKAVQAQEVSHLSEIGQKHAVDALRNLEDIKGFLEQPLIRSQKAPYGNVRSVDIREGCQVNDGDPFITFCPNSELDDLEEWLSGHGCPVPPPRFFCPGERLQNEALAIRPLRQANENQPTAPV